MKYALTVTAALVALAVISLDSGVNARLLSAPYTIPEFTHRNPDDWINSRPLARGDLEGKVVLIDFWTFGCVNCYKSFPWLKSIENKYEQREFAVLGVHTPEFDHEKDRRKVADKVKEFGIEHAVMIDNDFSYWKALDNRYWPSFYLIDKTGMVRAVYVGEMREGGDQANRVEAQIEALLSELG